MKTMNLKTLSKLYKNVELFDGRKGYFTAADKGELELLKSALADSTNTGVHLLQPFDIEKLTVGTRVKLELSDPRTGLGLLADSFDDVLQFRKGKIQKSRFYLIENAWYSEDDNGPAIVDKYLSVLKLVELLGLVAAYLDKDTQELVFVNNGKFILPVQYVTNDIEQINQDSLSKLLSFFESPIHKEQKLRILEKVICQKYKKTTEEHRFAKLLNELSDIFKQLDEGYAIFASDFSYEKVVDQLEVTKLEELAKINKIFSDIQNQILGIPVATVIVATQLKSTREINDLFWINTAVLIGVWIFVVLIDLVLRNQKHTLNSVKYETERKQTQIICEYNFLHKTVKNTFDLIFKRITHQKVVLHVVDFIVTVGFILAHIVYFALTEPAYYWFSILNI